MSNESTVRVIVDRPGVNNENPSRYVVVNATKRDTNRMVTYAGCVDDYCDRTSSQRKVKVNQAVAQAIQFLDHGVEDYSMNVTIEEKQPDDYITLWAGQRVSNSRKY